MQERRRPTKYPTATHDVVDQAIVRGVYVFGGGDMQMIVETVDGTVATCVCSPGERANGGSLSRITSLDGVVVFSGAVRVGKTYEEGTNY